MNLVKTETDTKVHKHLILKGCSKNPILDEDYAKRWILSFVELLGMQVLAKPVARYCSETGNRGISVAVLITTSHIAAHFWDEPVPAPFQVDVYSCKDIDMSCVSKALRDIGAVDVCYRLINRDCNNSYTDRLTID